MEPKVARAWRGVFRLARIRTKRALRHATGTPLVPPELVFGPRYREKVTLRDGTILWLRLVRRGDAPLLEAGLAALSPTSRYNRFHSAKDHFTCAELRYLTQVDQLNHVVLGAYRRVGAQREGVAIARFIRLPDNPQYAEAAFAVADAFQGMGVGRLLIERLQTAAGERGITTLRCEVLAQNRAARGLLEGRFGAHVIAYEGLSVVLEISTQNKEEPLLSSNLET